ncbi:MAG TPA: glycerol-3-phosphate dehydrogenase/oxidase [Terriglobales bacterium]|nr:glycerol-3-phosphate dehydrogenase/oxidase [Terriglobales bacterium]
MSVNPRTELNGEHFEVLVIGGGINGVAIARECARGGRRTLLVELQDFAAGTTSRSTRLIHGGLRYLEQGDIAQVRESLRERQKLLQQYPHLVHPLQFVLALDESSRRNALAVRAGLWLYRRMAGTGCAAVDGREERNRLERLLDAGRRFSIFNFEDAQCEFPELLVAEWLVEAMRAGCVARNHTRVLAVQIANGKVKGALLRDELSGLEESVEATWIVNATGPWADKICQDSGIRAAKPMVGGVRGSHIVLPKFTGAPETAVYTEAVDGRPIFVIPWNEQILVGTTEVPDSSDPACVRPSHDEIEYLLRSLRRLFPLAEVSRRDVRYSFAGIRPLPYSPQSEPLAITRRHCFHDHGSEGAAGMISLVGGKLTTAGSVARECAEKMGIRRSGVPAIDVPAELGDRLSERAIAEISAVAGIGHKSASVLFEWYGPRSLEIARTLHKDPRLRTCLCPHTDHVVAEAVDAFENQSASTLGDVLLRRVPVALGACWSAECGRTAASRIAAAMGWDDARAGVELEHFEAECSSFLQREGSPQSPSHVDAGPRS